MSVKIELLDYVYDKGINLTNCNGGSNSGTTQGTWTVNSDIKITWDGTSGASSPVHYWGNGTTTGVVDYKLQSGKTYNLSFEITNYSGSGDMGFSSQNGLPTTFRAAGNQTFNGQFTVTSDFKPRLYGRGTNNGVISNLKITQANAIDWENSIAGELDVSNHGDFPLALTFQIAEVQNITSTTGNYSKTFKIPATKHNNQLLKNLYIANSTHENTVTAMKKCRIMVNDMYSLEGLLQVTGVGGYGERTSYYDCVFYGNNVNWSALISEELLKDLDWGTNPDTGGTKLTYNKSNIMTTWNDSDCTSSSSYVVYPVTSYGQYNMGGNQDEIQLLDTAYDATGGSSAKLGYKGWWNGGTEYPTPNPSPDWRPCIWVKDTLTLMFRKVGYTLDSEFMNTSVFKQLVWSLPNFKYNNSIERFELHSIIGDMDAGTINTENPSQTNSTGGNLNMGQTYWNTFAVNPSTGTGTINFEGGRLGCGDTDCSASSYGYDSSNGKFTVPEYGYYTIKMSGFSARMDDLNYTDGGGTAQTYFRLRDLYVRVGLGVKTIGQTSTNYIWGDTVETTDRLGWQNFAASDVYESIDFNIPEFEDRRWYNKGDEITLYTKIRYETNNWLYNLNSFEFDFYLGNEYGSASNKSFYSIEFEPEIVEYGQQYDISKVIAPELKQIDFIKGVAHAFNLKISTDEETKSVKVEPFDDFYKPLGNAIDWTYKLDRSREAKDKWLKTDIKRDVVFKYKTDSTDAMVQHRAVTYFNDIQDEYPYYEVLSSAFEMGKAVFENPFFAGTFCAKDRAGTGTGGQVKAPYGGCLWTEQVSSADSGRPEKGFDFTPRLLYYNKYSPSYGNTTTRRWAKVQTWDNITQTVKANNSTGSTGLSKKYPQATSYNREKTSYPNLCYGNVAVKDFDEATNAFAAGVYVKGLYETYYDNMVEMLKLNPRLRTVYIDLKISDIVNLDFGKLIYIDGVYWRINRIVDYKPNKNTPTQVELVEWVQTGTSAAKQGFQT